MTDTRNALPPAPPAFHDGHGSGLLTALPPAMHPSHERRADGRTGSGSIPIEDADVTDLRRKLATLPVIEQAKGMLIGLYGCDADTAYKMLRRWSCDHNLKLRSLCADLVAAAGRTHPEPFGALRTFLRSHHLS